MPEFRKKIERLTALLIGGILLLNFPLLAIFHQDALWFGLPALYMYFVTAWALFIALVAVILERS